MNLYPEAIAGDGGASEEAVLVRTPGLRWISAIDVAGRRGRAMIKVNNRCFAVAGDTFFEIIHNLDGTYGAQSRGVVGDFAGAPAPILRTNGVQILIVNLGYAYTYSLETTPGTFAAIPFPGFNFQSVAVVDTYFIASTPVSNEFHISAPLNGSSWSAIDFGSTQEADFAVGIEELHGYLWIFGSNSIVVFQDTGNASFPFQRVPGSKIEMGLAALGSLCKLDNSIFWLGSSSRGPAVVYRADGFLPSRISTHALEAAIQGYATVDDATSYAYEERGHLFYRLDFPTAGATWVYDVATKAWHERGYWNTATGAYTMHLAQVHAFCFGMHVVMDAAGKVYEQSLEYSDDAGSPLRWLRRAPHIDDKAGRRKLFYRRFELIMNTGFDTDPGASPQVFLRWSNDGGVTWAADVGASVSAGLVGQYARRVIWRQLGAARSRVFEVSGSDPLPDLVLIGAELRLEQGIS